MAGPPYSWEKDIKQLFRAVPDVEHMKDQGLDLSSYDVVSKAARRILRRLKDADDPMPPVEDGGPWPPDKIAIFEWWATNGTPR